MTEGVCTDAVLWRTIRGIGWRNASGVTGRESAERVQLGLLPRALQLHLPQGCLQLEYLCLLLFQSGLQWRYFNGSTRASITRVGGGGCPAR